MIININTADNCFKAQRKSGKAELVLETDHCSRNLHNLHLYTEEIS